MNTKSKNLVLFLLFVSFSLIASSQIKFMKGDVELKEGDQFKKVDLETLKARVSADQMRLYDLVVISVYTDKSDMNPLAAAAYSGVGKRFEYYPKLPSFQHDLADGKWLDLWVNDFGWYAHKAKIDIEMRGFYEDGEETYYDTYSNSYKTRKLYGKGRVITTSPKIQYIKDKKR